MLQVRPATGGHDPVISGLPFPAPLPTLLRAIVARPMEDAEWAVSSAVRLLARSEIINMCNGGTVIAPTHAVIG